MKKSHLKFIMILLLAGAFVWAAAVLPISGWMQKLVTGVQSFGALGFLLYAAVYIVVTLTLLPASILSIGAGFAYGIQGGFLLVMCASMLGALLAFLAAKHWFRDWVVQKIENRPKLRAVERAVSRRDFYTILLLRLSPLFHFGLLNYFLGLTKTSARTYLLSSTLGVIPGVLLYVGIGSLITDATALADPSASDSVNVWKTVLLVVGIAATAAVVVLISRTAKQALAAELKNGEQSSEKNTP